MTKKSGAIGVFDSGLGGLTAVRVLKKILPYENIIYFGDTGRVPYGTRSSDIITSYALDDMNFLSSFGIKAALVACGTVSSIAIEVLRKKFDIPIIGVVESAANKACKVSKNKRIAVLATPATIKNAAHEKYIKENYCDFRVSGIGCPMFVPLVENGYISGNCEITKIVADEYISKLYDFSPDTIILGCTHYPIISSIIKESAQRILQKNVELIDSGEQAAISLKEFLESNSLLNTQNCGNVEYFVSDETHNFKEAASIFLGETITNVKKIDISKYRHTEKNEVQK